MRYLSVLSVLSLLLLASCSWWPWGAKNTDNCLDDDSCDNANPFEERLVGGVWHCQADSGDEDWDCARADSSGKVLSDKQVLPDKEVPEETQQEPAAEIRQAQDAVMLTSKDLLAFSDDSYVIQLAALQYLDDINDFAAANGIESPIIARVDNQGVYWYVLILEVFDDREAANQAIVEWEETHKPATKPWARPMHLLKEAIRRALPSDT